MVKINKLEGHLGAIKSSQIPIINRDRAVTSLDSNMQKNDVRKSPGFTIELKPMMRPEESYNNNDQLPVLSQDYYPIRSQMVTPIKDEYNINFRNNSNSNFQAMPDYIFQT